MGRAGIEPATLGLKVPDNKIGQDRTQPTQQGSSQREQWLSALNQGNDEELSVPAVTPNPLNFPAGEGLAYYVADEGFTVGLTEDLAAATEEREAGVSVGTVTFDGE